MSVDGGLRKIFRDNLPGQWTPIETGAVALGVPDSEYCLPGGKQGWIEFKKCKANAVVIRPMQVGWIEKRVRMGGRVLVAVRRGGDLFVYAGAGVRELKVGGLSAAKKHLLGSWTGGRGRWNWKDIYELLIL